MCALVNAKKEYKGEKKVVLYVTFIELLFT